MSIFAIGDLHLPGGETKPMDIFGPHWANHFDKIKADWTRRVSPGDLVLLPGDLSWAMHLADALPDLHAIAALPGRKVILRGNHDYWWSSISRLRAALPEGMYALQNDAIAFPDAIVCGTRGWVGPWVSNATQEDERIYARELTRLALSLKAAQKLRQQQPDTPLLAMLHYPPTGEHGQETEITRLLAEEGVCTAVYGHLHGPGLQNAFQGVVEGVRYHLVSCDGLNFSLLQIA